MVLLGLAIIGYSIYLYNKSNNTLLFVCMFLLGSMTIYTQIFNCNPYSIIFGFLLVSLLAYVVYYLQL